MPSFDVVSKVDLQEVDNAVNQARKEISTRYDFQGTHTTLELEADKATIQLKSSTEAKLQAAYEVLQTKLAKRGVPLRSVVAGDIQTAGLSNVRREVKLQQGIPVEKAKDLVKVLKDSKMKVQGSIQGDQLRITGKNRDDLQAAIALFRQQQDRLEVELQFTNFRD